MIQKTNPSSRQPRIQHLQASFLAMEEECNVTIAHDVREAYQLIETCFEYVTEMNGAKMLSYL